LVDAFLAAVKQETALEDLHFGTPVSPHLPPSWECFQLCKPLKRLAALASFDSANLSVDTLLPPSSSLRSLELNFMDEKVPQAVAQSALTTFSFIERPLSPSQALSLCECLPLSRLQFIELKLPEANDDDCWDRLLSALQKCSHLTSLHLSLPRATTPSTLATFLARTPLKRLTLQSALNFDFGTALFASPIQAQELNITILPGFNFLPVFLKLVSSLRSLNCLDLTEFYLDGEPLEGIFAALPSSSVRELLFGHCVLQHSSTLNRVLLLVGS
jgi:hypothetical protein